MQECSVRIFQTLVISCFVIDELFFRTCQYNNSLSYLSQNKVLERIPVQERFLRHKALQLKSTRVCAVWSLILLEIFDHMLLMLLLLFLIRFALMKLHGICRSNSKSCTCIDKSVLMNSCKLEIMMFVLYAASYISYSWIRVCMLMKSGIDEYCACYISCYALCTHWWNAVSYMSYLLNIINWYIAILTKAAC